MLTVSANTRNRVALADLGGVAVEGSPAAVSVTRLSGGETVEWATSEALPVTTCPDMLTLTWEVSGINVKAQLEVLATQYCTLDEIRAYRTNEYQLTELSDEEVGGAYAHAVEVLERECCRFFIPVLREALIERTNCTAAKYPVITDGYANDIQKVVSATYMDTGATAPVEFATSATVNVLKVKPKRPIRAVLELGLGFVPREIHDAVVALAAWYLVPKAAPDNATSTSTDAGVLRFVVGGVGGAETSLPEVNAAIQRWGIKDYYVR